MSLLSVAVNSFTGMLTIPKLMRPFHIDLGMTAPFPGFPELAKSISMIPETRESINATGYPAGRKLARELRQPRVIRVAERDRLPEPVALFFGQVGQKSKEVGFVLEATAPHLLLDAEVGRGLEEKQDFGDDRGQTPRRRLNAIP